MDSPILTAAEPRGNRPRRQVPPPDSGRRRVALARDNSSDFPVQRIGTQRFVRAMTTMVGVHHPNLIALYGAGKQGTTCWFAMEYVDGEPLTKLIEKFGTLKMLDWRFALLVGVHIAQALEAAHEKHIIHRNVAPESILVRNKDKIAKLGDMMLAKALEGIKA